LSVEGVVPMPVRAEPMADAETVNEVAAGVEGKELLARSRAFGQQRVTCCRLTGMRGARWIRDEPAARGSVSQSRSFLQPMSVKPE